MSTFTEDLHPRWGDGKFATKAVDEAPGGTDALADEFGDYWDASMWDEADAPDHDDREAAPTAEPEPRPRDALLAPTSGLERRRRALLDSRAFIPAVALDDDLTARSPAAWWDVQSVTAQHGIGEPHKVDPDTELATYHGGGLSLRMPSADALREFSRQVDDDTFDFPVSYSRGEQEVSGWVRATRTSPTSWSVRPLSMDSEQHVPVRAAVTAVLESTRPTHSLDETRDIVADYRRRSTGVPMTGVRSSWVDAVGYDDATGTLVTQVRDQAYGHLVDQKVFERIRDARSPGAVFNALVRGSDRAEVETCPGCGRFTVAGGAKHTCGDPRVVRTQVPLADPVRRRAVDATGGR
ncbi:hypothetical protein [Isoptericola croceus]|uniref:hypothetical protein n=1 Tax=Isoptericola croceus TaxID=3031406 RepID=UPI0023F74575|nr:hypothetical protein [Isoptericola croceus]